MESLSVNNLIESDNPILHKILQYLDFDSLQAFSQTINTSLRAALDKSFDLHRKLNPWMHNKKQSPLKLYWRYQSFDIEHSNKVYGRCLCIYCLDNICCIGCWYLNCRCSYSMAIARPHCCRNINDKMEF